MTHECGHAGDVQFVWTGLANPAVRSNGPVRHIEAFFKASVETCYCL